MPDYTRVCPWWLAWTFDNPLRKWLQDPQRILGGYVEAGMTVADIGCGMGYFSVPMAKMVGPSGKVIAVDLQATMLRCVAGRARRAGVEDRIEMVLASEDDIKISLPVDFVLAFWVVHEVKNVPRFFGQVAAVLKPQGKMLVAELDMHVTREQFDASLVQAESAGFVVTGTPHVRWSRAVVLAYGSKPSTAGLPRSSAVV